LKEESHFPTGYKDLKDPGAWMNNPTTSLGGETDFLCYRATPTRGFDSRQEKVRTYKGKGGGNIAVAAQRGVMELWFRLKGKKAKPP